MWALSNNILFAAIFLSGFSALIYQLIWVRLLGLVFGVSSLAVATVVAVFLLGLALGSLYFGKRADKSQNPLRDYVLLEFSIPLLSIISYIIITYIPVYQWAYEYSYNNLGFYGISIIRLILSIIVLLPPVFAIGGTIPLLSKYFLTSSTTFGSNFSWIYFFNTFGAFAGSIFTGFISVKFFGVFQSMTIAVISNLVVALVIVIKKNQATLIPQTTSHRPPFTYMLIILFFTGLISISYEVLWVRILSTYNLATSHSFALIVSGFLLGFSIGSSIVSKKIDTMINMESYFGRINIYTAISGAAVLFLFQRFDFITLKISAIFQANLFSVSLFLAFIVSLVPAIFMGILFPLGLKIYSSNIDHIGVKTGNIFFFNTIGCVTGSIITGFILIPFAGMWNTTILLVNISLLIAAYMIFLKSHYQRKYIVYFSTVFLLSNLLIFSDQKTFHTKINGFKVIYYSEGISGTVTAVERKDYRGLFVDGQNVSGTDPVLIADSKMLAHLPLLVSNNPQNALTVGYGTGATSYSMLTHNILVDAVEIEEKIIDAGPLFGKVNFHSYNNPSLNIVLDDARNYINMVNKKYDVIVTDVTNLKYKRNPYLYTKEYFQIMQKALSEDGIAAAWLPLGGLSFNDLKVLIATFKEVYNHTSVWYFTQYPTHFVIVIGTPSKAHIDIERLASDMQEASVDLKRIGIDNEYELASMLLLGEKDVADLVANSKIHTDNNPILEYSDMQDYMLVDVEDNLKRLLKYKKEELSKYFKGNEAQLEKLDEHLIKYKRHFHNYANSKNRSKQR